MINHSFDASKIYFKTFRCNNQNDLDHIMTSYVHSHASNIAWVKSNVSAFYVPLADLPQHIDNAQKKNLEQRASDNLNLATQIKGSYLEDKDVNPTTSFFNYNKAMQPIQFVGHLEIQAKHDIVSFKKK